MSDKPRLTQEEYTKMEAEQLDWLIDEASQEEATVCLPRSLVIAVLTLLEYLLEDSPGLPPPIVRLPPPFDMTAVRLAHAIAVRGKLDRP